MRFSAMTKSRNRIIILIMCIFLCIGISGCISPNKNPIPVEETKMSNQNLLEETKMSTPIPSLSGTPAPQNRWVRATIKHFVLNPGDTVSVEGIVSGSTDPMSYSVFTLDDVKSENLQKPLLTDSVVPASDGSYQFSFPVNLQKIPVGSYVILIQLSTGETTKLQFLVEAKGVDCETICSQPGPSLRYNDKGEAVCPC
jgi:hypothetical protein